MESNSVSTGSLKTKISLKNGNTQVALPFYGMKPKLPPSSQVLGSDDLISRFDLSSAFARFCGPKKPKEDLASFIGGICGITRQFEKTWFFLYRLFCQTFLLFLTSNCTMNVKDPSCSLRSLVDKPPITGREIMNLSSSVMSGFKLAAGPIPENYRFFDTQASDAALLNGQDASTSDKNPASTSETDPTKQKRMKRALEDFEVPEFEKKKRRGEEKSERKKKKKKDKKKEKDGKRKDKETRDLPFY